MDITDHVNEISNPRLNYLGEYDMLKSKFPEVVGYVDLLLSHWKENPTTLGHGFAHVLAVAIEAVKLGEANNYNNPVELFIGGLFHDIYRPAEGLDGGEDQSRGAAITHKLLEEHGTNHDIVEKVVNMINSHDEWRDQQNPPILDLIVSIADKISHTPIITNSYVWASNKYLKEHNMPPKYKSHMQTLYAFNKYQMRAWEIFMKHPVTGTELAVESYNTIVCETINAYREDPNGEHFAEYVEAFAQNYREREITYLAHVDLSQEEITKLMIRCY
jgi:HD superfamily phosphohydrolase YqeK